MVERYKLEDCTKKGDRIICPACKDHEQIENPYEECDCKNLILNDESREVGQCMCYSEVHI